MGYALSDLAAKQGSPPLDLQFCEYLNISVCPASQSDSVRRLWRGRRCVCPAPWYGRGRRYPDTQQMIHEGGEGEEVYAMETNTLK